MLNITCETIADSLNVVDVTDHLPDLQCAFEMVAYHYSKLSSQPITIQEVLSDLCLDIYYTNGRTRTLLAKGMNPITGAIEPIGTVRIVLGTDFDCNNVPYPLESMSLLSPPEGWRHFSFGDFSPGISAEFGRFVITPSYRSLEAKTKGYTALLCKSIFRALITTANKYNKYQLWAIVPLNVLHLAHSADITIIPVPQIILNADHAHLFEKYNKYWYQGNPWFYKFIPEDQKT